MGIYDYDDLVMLDKLYNEILKDCNFVGEIVLEEEELDKICKSLIEYILDRWDERFNNVLIVSCVNLAYYYYDDRGYWPYFEEKVGMKLDGYFKSVIGNKIEVVLEEKGFIKFKRKGPFRYVGAVLEQTGVTHNNIPCYASIVKNMIDTYGVKGVLNLSINKYERYVNDFPITKRIKDYLLDRAGWEFNNYIVKTIYYMQEGLLSLKEVESFKGIHPRFWDEFLKHFSVNISYRQKDVLRRFNPVLMLNVKARVLYLKFPQSTFDIDINNKVIHCNNTSEFIIDKVSNIKSSYSGKVITRTYGDYMWRTNGWDYLQEKYIYFNEKGYVVKNIDLISEGLYYIVSRVKEDIPRGNIIEIVGDMNIYNLIGYKLFKVEIKEKKIKKQNSYIFLEWENCRNKLYVNSYFEIFQNKLPKIKVDNIGINQSKDSGIFYDIGTGIKRVADVKELSDFYSDVNNHIPCIGEIWTETLNRNRDVGRLSELKFCLIPKCKLDIPQGLYREDEAVRIVSNSPFVKFKHYSNDNHDMVNVKKQTLIEGSINISNQVVDFNFLVNRTKLILDDNEERMYFSMDEDGIFQCTIYGVAYDSGVLLIKSDKNDIEIKRNVIFDSEGKCTINIKNIIEFLNVQEFNFCTIDLIIKNKTYSMKRYIINVAYLIKNLNGITQDYEVMKIIKDIDINIFKKLIQIQTLILDTPEYIEYIEDCKHSNALNEFYNYIVICSQVFNNLNIIKDNEILRLDYGIIKSIKVKKALAWYDKATKAILEDNELEMKLLCEEYNLIQGTELLRWQHQIDSMYSRLIELMEKDARLLQWKEEVIKQNKRKINSDVSKKTGGRELTIAWIEYYKGNYEKCIRIINSLDYSDDILADLICLLKIIIYLKLARLSAANKEFSKNIKNTYVKSVVDMYKGIYLAINNDIESLRGDSINLSIFPLRDEDINLIKTSGALRNYKDKKDITKLKSCIKDVEGNWILEVLLVNCLKAIRDSDEGSMVSKIIIDINSIPNSPEKNNILEIINK